MAELGNVINGLRCLSNPYIQDMDERDCENCKYDNASCFLDVTADALSLLKAQEPRVMTLKEIVSAECVWIEYATSGNIVIALPWDIELSDDTYNFIGMPNCFVEFRSLYGESWRCWTSRPTDEQRKETQWSEPPKEET